MKKHVKAQNEWANINIVEVISNVDPTPTNKFLPLLVKTYKSLDTKMKKYESEWLINNIVKNSDYTYEYLNTLSYTSLQIIWSVIDRLMSENVTFELLNDFNAHLEENRIEKNDISGYKNIDELKIELSKANTKKILKESRSHTHLVYEDDNWLLLKPLTLESSVKYGHMTKWCTTMVSGNYFYRYSRNGVLIYSIDKVNDRKFAIHIPIDEGEEKITFRIYDEMDNEIDSYFTGYPQKIMNIICDEFSNKQTNLMLVKEKYPDIYQKFWVENVLSDDKIGYVVDQEPDVPNQEVIAEALYIDPYRYTNVG